MSKKHEVPANNLINWSYLSMLLTGKKQNIRQDLVPGVHSLQVDDLRKRVEGWLRCWDLPKKE